MANTQDGARELRTVLLVDDENYFRRFVGEVVRRHFSMKVLEATDGLSAIRSFTEQRPDLVLLDINMPHMGGMETLSALRKLSAAVPIIMLTSVSEEMIVEECVGLGASFFIRKDVPAAELIEALKQTLAELSAAPDAGAAQ